MLQPPLFRQNWTTYYVRLELGLNGRNQTRPITRPLAKNCCNGARCFDPNSEMATVAERPQMFSQNLFLAGCRKSVTASSLLGSPRVQSQKFREILGAENEAGVVAPANPLV